MASLGLQLPGPSSVPFTIPHGPLNLLLFSLAWFRFSVKPCKKQYRQTFMLKAWDHRAFKKWKTRDMKERGSVYQSWSKEEAEDTLKRG